MALLFFSLHFLALATLTFSLPLDHDDSKRSALPSAWYHGDDHPVAKLFRRQNATISAVGSDGTHEPIITTTLIGDPSFLFQLGRLFTLPAFPKQTSLQSGCKP